jgi:hypothetical protein
MSQSFKHIRLTHCKIKVHIHEFYKRDKKCEEIQKSISYWLSMILIWFFNSWKVNYDNFK